MDLTFCIDKLSENRQVIVALLKGVTDEEAKWRSAPEKWSFLEIINHLYDEEREDFRTRVRLTLFEPEQTWPGIDPQGWVAEREYGKRDFKTSINNFLDERELSLQWLQTLKDKDLNWRQKYHHPQGIIRAGDLMTSWIAHDLLHIRQITKLHWDFLNQHCHPFTSTYAGNW